MYLGTESLFLKQNCLFFIFGTFCLLTLTKRGQMTIEFQHQSILMYFIQKQPPEKFCKKALLEISQNSQENTCARAPFLIKLQACNLCGCFSSLYVHKFYPLKMTLEQGPTLSHKTIYSLAANYLFAFVIAFFESTILDLKKISVFEQF